MARGKTKQISLVKTPDSEQGSSWDFPVFQEELKTSRGIASGIHAVIREDSGAVIGQYKGNKVLPYPVIVERFETALTAAQITFQRSFITTANGGRFWGRYDIGNGAHVGGDSFRKIIRLQSSHNGSLTPGFSLEMERLACLNGMMGMAQVFALFRKHSENFDLSFISENIVQSIESGTNHALETVERMGNIPVNDGQARNILSNVVNMGKVAGVSPKTGLLIYNNWQNPSADEKPLGNTLYRLYNAATRLSRDIITAGRFEMGRKANMYVTGAFDLATRRNTDLEKLLASPGDNALDFDGVTVLN